MFVFSDSKCRVEKLCYGNYDKYINDDLKKRLYQNYEREKITAKHFQKDCDFETITIVDRCLGFTMPDNLGLKHGKEANNE